MKADLVLTSRSGRKTYQPNSTLYFSSTRKYTPAEVKNEIRTQKDKILERLNEIRKGKVVITAMSENVEEITVDKVVDGWVYYNSGVTPILAIIEI